MMPYITECLAGLVCYLSETISLKEVKFQRLLLLWSKVFPNTVQESSGNDLVDNDSTGV